MTIRVIRKWLTVIFLSCHMCCFWKVIYSSILLEQMGWEMIFTKYVGTSFRIVHNSAAALGQLQESDGKVAGEKSIEQKRSVHSRQTTEGERKRHKKWNEVNKSSYGNAITIAIEREADGAQFHLQFNYLPQTPLKTLFNLANERWEKKCNNKARNKHFLK